MQIIKSKKVYDAVIVGSGAGGGMATKVLADAGLKVAVMEAGPFFDPANPEQRTQLKWPYESPRRGAGTQLLAIPSSIGSDHECWEEERTTGEESPCVLVRVTSKEKSVTDWVKTGPLDMMT